MTVGALASPYVSPYLYESKRRGLDTVYGIRREGGVFMIGDSQVSVDRDGNIHIKDVEFPATKGLWERLTRKKVDKDSLKQYKTILKMTNAHLEGYKPDANIHASKGNKFRDVISKLFPGGGPRQSGVEAALHREWITYKVMLRRLYTDPAAASAFSSLQKLQQAVRHAPSSKQQRRRKRQLR